MSNAKTVLIITPTYNRPYEIVERCMRSVLTQTYVFRGDCNIDHLIISDQEDTPKELEELSYWDDNNVFITTTSTSLPNSNTWGAYPRQFGLDFYKDKEYDYVMFLDDDNIIFPHYVEKQVNNIEHNNLDASICGVLHNGPLHPQYFSHSPNVVWGRPPLLRNIDTLNVMFKREVFEKHRWVCKVGEEGYCNDGETYEKIFMDDSIRFGYFDEILAVHL